MQVLVVFSSRHGATEEVAARIGERIAAGGFTVTIKRPGEVESLNSFDAVVLGSAVYMSQWMEDIQNFVRRNIEELNKRLVWVFSVGMDGVPGDEVRGPRNAKPFIDVLQPVDYGIFKGRIDSDGLSIRERSIVRLVGKSAGDYREWEKIDAWAKSITQKLTMV